MSSEFDKKWTINVIGAGNLAKPYVFELAKKIANGDESIKKVNWWVREYNIKEGITHREDLESTIEQNLTGYTSEKNTKAYTQAMDKIKVIGFKTIEDLKKIAEESKKQNFVKESSLTLILTRYDLGFLFKESQNPYSSTILKECVPKNVKEIELLDTEKLILAANTSRYTKRPEIYEHYPEFERTESIEDLLKIQKQVLGINEALELYCKKANKEHFRLNGLAYTLIGNQALAKAFEGYEGIIINMVNPVEISNYQFALYSKISANKIFAPVENDHRRFIVFILQAYKETFGESFKGELIVPPILGPHNEFIYADQKQIFFDKKPFDSVFYSHSPKKIFDQIIDKTRTYGINYAKIHGKAPEDTVYNSLITTTDIILKSEDTPLRGCVYDKDNEIFTGSQFILRDEKVILIKKAFGEMDKKVFEQLENSIKNDKDLLNFLISSKETRNVLREYQPKKSEIPQIFIDGVDWGKKIAEKKEDGANLVKTATKSFSAEMIIDEPLENRYSIKNILNSTRSTPAGREKAKQSEEEYGFKNILESAINTPEGKEKDILLDTLFSKFKSINIQPIKPDSWTNKEYFNKHMCKINTEIMLPKIVQIVDSDINIRKGGKLILSKGTELIFAPDTELLCLNGCIMINGADIDIGIYKDNTLISRSSRDSLVLLNGKQWRGLKLRDSNSSISGCYISDAVYSGISAINSQITINNILLKYNIAKQSGAGMYIEESYVKLRNSYIMYNTALNHSGGGIYIKDSRGELSNNTITNNKAKIGGGMCISNSSYKFGSNNLLSNEATESGGGIYIYDSKLDGRSNNIELNQSREGGGITAYCSSTFGKIETPLDKYNTIKDNKSVLLNSDIKIISFS